MGIGIHSYHGMDEDYSLYKINKWLQGYIMLTEKKFPWDGPTFLLYTNTI